jgi:hypothetical protein
MIERYHTSITDPRYNGTLLGVVLCIDRQLCIASYADRFVSHVPNIIFVSIPLRMIIILLMKRRIVY